MNLLPSTEYTEWQWPLSGVHSIMMEMEKFAQAGEAGGARPAPVTLSTIIKYKDFVYRTLPLFLLYSYVYSMSLPNEKPTSKGTNREPSLVLSVSESLVARLFY